MEIIKNTERRKYQRGPTPWAQGWGARPLPRGPPGGPPVPIFCYYEVFHPKKNHKQAFGTRLHRHEAEPWRNQSRALVELSCRGHFPPGGGNHRQRHHQRSSHREGANIHQHLLSNPSSSLVSNLCPKTSDWYLCVASSVDYFL